MMINFIYKIIFIQTAISTRFSDSDDQIFLGLIISLNDETKIRNWMENRGITSLCAFEMFFEILNSIKEVISVINIGENLNFNLRKIKSLIIKTKIDIEELTCPYYETFIIIESVKQIFKIIDTQNIHNLERQDISIFSKKLLYEVYDEVYKCLKFTIIRIGFEYNPIETQTLFSNWVLCSEDHGVESPAVTCNAYLAVKLIKLSSKILDSILPMKYMEPVYVKADYLSFKNSRRSFDGSIHRFNRKKSNTVCTEELPQYPMRLSTKQSLLNQFDLKEYMNENFSCDKITAKILITLFHFFSQIREKNTTYEIILDENNMYQIRWTMSKIQPKKDLKNYWLQKPITNLSERKLMHKFGFLVNYNFEFSTVKSSDTFDEPIETRLIVLECGHQLGFDLIDEFLEHFYHKNTKPLTCHICRQPIYIVGSYNAIVHRCK